MDVAFTFDFDAEEVWIGEDPANADRPGVLSQGTYGAKVAVPLILELLDRHDIKSTFFVPGRVGERHPHRVREIVAAGHEIGLHGYTHTSPQNLTPEQERDELAKATEILTDLGATLHGYRSPSWEFSEHTVGLLAGANLRYSSNFMDDIRPYVHPDSDLVELPVQWILDDAPHFWFANDTWNKKMATTGEVRQIWEEEFLGIRRLDGVCIFTMHPQIIGRPSRLAFLDAFIGFVKGHTDVRIRSCAEIAADVTAKPGA